MSYYNPLITTSDNKTRLIDLWKEDLRIFTPNCSDPNVPFPQEDELFVIVPNNVDNEHAEKIAYDLFADFLEEGGYVEVSTIRDWIFNFLRPELYEKLEKKSPDELIEMWYDLGERLPLLKEVDREDAAHTKINENTGLLFYN